MNPNPRTYMIQQGDQAKQVRGRDNAVRQALRWSQHRRFRPVQLERADHKMRLVSRKGALQNLVLELH